MDNKYHSILTRVGIEKLTRAQMNGTQVKLTDMAVGDMDREPDEEMTELGNEVWRGPINDMGVDPLNPSWIYTETHIPDDVGGFWVREAGVYDEDGDLIVISRQPASYKPLLDNGTAKQLIIRIITEVSNADTVELSIDPSIVMASRAYVDKKALTCEELIGQTEEWATSEFEIKQQQLDLLFSAVNRIMIENELNGKTDGGYGFFDALDGSTPKNMKLGDTVALIPKATNKGTTTIQAPNHAFKVGQEVTLFDDENFEDVIIKAVAKDTITTTTALQNSYKPGAKLVRSTAVFDKKHNAVPITYTTYDVSSQIV